MSPPRCDVVLLAAGMGTRLRSDAPKGLVLLGARPLFLYSLERFLAHPAAGRVALVVPDGARGEIQRHLSSVEGAGWKERGLLVAGGRLRQDSVLAGLVALREAGSPEERIVLVHDAARPFVTRDLIDRLLAAMENPIQDPGVQRLPGLPSAGEWGQGPAGVIPCLPVQDTLKVVYQDRVVVTQPRENLQAAQTPQAFRLGPLLEAHRRARELGAQATDDAGFLEWQGIPVRVVPGDGANFKVTYPLDLELAERWLRSAAD